MRPIARRSFSRNCQSSSHRPAARVANERPKIENPAALQTGEPELATVIGEPAVMRFVASTN